MANKHGRLSQNSENFSQYREETAIEEGQDLVAKMTDVVPFTN